MRWGGSRNWACWTSTAGSSLENEEHRCCCCCCSEHTWILYKTQVNHRCATWVTRESRLKKRENAFSFVAKLPLCFLSFFYKYSFKPKANHILIIKAGWWVPSASGCAKMKWSLKHVGHWWCHLESAGVWKTPTNSVPSPETGPPHTAVPGRQSGHVTAVFTVWQNQCIQDISVSAQHVRCI